MRTFSLVFAILFGMRVLTAQTACFIPTPTITWTNISASSLAFSSFNMEVLIDGVFVVDVDFEFDHAEVGFKLGSIEVSPGATLTIKNGSILTNIGADLWEGISVLSGGRVEVYDSEVCGAKTAIGCASTLSTAAEFEVLNSAFRFNENGIVISNYTAGPYPGFVESTHFEGGPLASGGVYTHSSVGIAVSGVDPLSGSGLRIGQASATISPNRFTDLDYGVKAFRTTLEVFNNQFEGIQDINGIGGGYAIEATSQTPGPYYLGVGTSDNFVNQMIDCRYGIFVDGYDSVRVSNNVMSAPTDDFVTGVTIERTRFIIAVLDNEIQQFSQDGILLNDNPGFGGGMLLDAAVSNNAIRGTNQTSRGIFVDEFVGGLTIKQDTIDRVWRGIGIQSSAGDFNIRENQVDFRYPGTSITPEPAAGIYVLSSDEALILRNTISGNCPSPAGGGPCNSYTVANSRIRGIQFNQTFNTRIYNNDIRYAGAGVYVQGPNDEGNMVFNNFFDTYSAVVWDNLPADGFGSTTGPGGPFTNRVYGLTNPTAWSENTFTSSISGYEPFRSWSINAADAATVDWFYQSAPTFDFPVGTIDIAFSVPLPTLLAPIIGSSTNVCGLLRVANENDSILNPGNSSEMLEEPGMSNNALTQRLVKLWIQGDLDSTDATMANLSLMDSSSAWLRTVWQIRTNALRTGGDLNGLGSYGKAAQTYSEEELFQLMQIALDTAAEQSTAVYLAQSMLDWSILQDRWQQPVVSERAKNSMVEQSGFVVFPNPAEHLLNIVSQHGIASIKLYNLRGDQVLELEALDQFAFTLSLEELPRGEYILRAIGMDGKQYATKLLKH